MGVITEQPAGAAALDLQPFSWSKCWFSVGVGPLIGNPRATCNFLWSSIVHCVRGNCDNTATQSKKSFPVRCASWSFIPFKERGEGAKVTDGITMALLTRFQLIIIPCIAPSQPGRRDQVNGVMNACCSVAQHWHCPSQEIKMLYPSCSLAETFLVWHVHLWLHLSNTSHISYNIETAAQKNMHP